MKKDDFGTDETDEEEIKEIIDKIEEDPKLPPYDTEEHKDLYSKRYKDYKKDEEKRLERNRYERLCEKSANLLSISADENIHQKLAPSLKLLGWHITPGMVLSASLVVTMGLLFAWTMLFSINLLLGFLIPNSLMILLILIPIMGGVYTFLNPIYAAKNKVIESSGEMILTILYMVVFLRKTPNLEGAVRFAALNLSGPISKDLKQVLWNVEIGEYSDIETSLNEYTKRWKNYNDDFLESLNLIKASMNEANPQRRENMLEDSIDRILTGTQEEMKHYAQGLKTPVMILNAMGAMLPVLGMIMLPLISVFMGGVITPIHLIMVFNILLPATLFWFMQRVLSSRPPTVSSKAANEDVLPPRGKYSFKMKDKNIEIPTWPIGLIVFLLIGSFGLIGYLLFPTFYPVENIDPAGVPSIFLEADGSANSFTMLLRSQLIILGLGLGIGISKILGSIQRKAAEEKIRSIESEFPTALFQLGNKVSGGTPIELALERAAESTNELEISDLFEDSSRNIRKMGMTFEQSLFDEKYGALKEYPSQLINTVMRAILRSSEKGTSMASTAMMTISNYLKNIHKTQEKLNDLMEETKTTIMLIAYLLAPIVSGVAVGMSQTIISAMFQLSQSFDEATEVDEGIDEAPETAGGGAPEIDGIIGDLDAAIPPELLQLVVGVYLIQLLYILGTFFMKITEGENPTYKNLFIGKILISGITFFTITAIIVTLLFGGVIDGFA